MDKLTYKEKLAYLVGVLTAIGSQERELNSQNMANNALNNLKIFID